MAIMKKISTFPHPVGHIIHGALIMNVLGFLGNSSQVVSVIVRNIGAYRTKIYDPVMNSFNLI